MKGLILSGGAGTRLRPITHTSAKQLVPIANKPILFYGIEDMAAAGIKDIGIVVGDTRDEIMAVVGDGSQFGVDVTFIPQDAPRGLAHAVHIARDFLGEDDFVMYLGDNMLEQGLATFVDQGRHLGQRVGGEQLGRRGVGVDDGFLDLIGETELFDGDAHLARVRRGQADEQVHFLRHGRTLTEPPFKGVCHL